MILPEDIPYLKTEAEQTARSIHMATWCKRGDDSDVLNPVSTMTRRQYAARVWDAGPAPLDQIRALSEMLADLTRHESRFAAARWLESQGRPGWRFLDGPGPLTAEQSARVLHEACIRARDGATAIVGVLGPWEHVEHSQFRERAILVRKPSFPRGLSSIAYELVRDQVTVSALDENLTSQGWFCL